MLKSRIPAAIQFDRYELDLVRQELLADGIAAPIQPQPLKALVLLATQAGKLVTREQMQEHLWPGVTATDVERSLNHTIRKLRQVLEDDARHPRFIQTVARRGYRFIAEYEVIRGGSRASSESSQADSTWLDAGPLDTVDAVGLDPIVRLRISGFREISDDRAWPLLSEGVVEELITRLVGLRASGLSVLDDTFRSQSSPGGDARPSFFGLKGCVRRSGATVSVNAHLAQLPEGALVATTAFEQELGNVFDLQGSASERIIQDLILPLLKSAQVQGSL